VIEVGKRAGYEPTPQVFIEKLLLMLAKQGKTVARLKGGDSFVFGRGGEELQALLDAGIEVEVIPGITAGIGVPAMLGIPVTHRDHAHGVTFVTGHGADVNWHALVRAGTTLVIYMGVRNLEAIKRALKAAGMDPATPACIIENGTLPTQRQMVSTLGQLAGAGFHGPALIVVGAVVGLAHSAAEEKAKAA
jgi:uroporphyrin-III C-methyltransferase